MRRWVVVAVAVVALWALGEWAAQRYLAQRIERRVAERIGVADLRVDADVGTYPVVTRTLVTGALDRLTLTLRPPEGAEVVPATLRLHLDQVRIDRTTVLSGEADVTGLGSGRAALRVDLGGLPSAVTAAIGGLDLEPYLDLTRRGVVVDLPLLPAVEVPLPGPGLPCDPDVSVAGGALVLGCTFTEAPPFLERI